MTATETIRIPACEGSGVRIRAGDRVRVIDPEGGQVADVFAFCVDDPSEYHSAEHTRVRVDRLFPRVGEQFVTNRRRPILTFEADDSPGVRASGWKAGTHPARRTCSVRCACSALTELRYPSRSTCS